jgi:hypothetical protein
MAQVVKRLAELKYSDQKQPCDWHYMHISTKLKDSCFMLKDNNYAFVVERKDQNERLVCEVVLERSTQSFFDIPADSKNAVQCITKLKDTDSPNPSSGKLLPQTCKLFVP